jgi:hypothetical protein
VSCDYDISCDGCGTVIDGSSLSFAAARRKIREAGGRVNLPAARTCARPASRRETSRNEHYGAGDSDVVAVHAETIGYRVIDALREHGLTITRKR